MGRVPNLSGRAEYERLYKWSLEKPADFWAHMAQQQGLYFKQKVIHNFFTPTAAPELVHSPC